jgi:hypothetical protein
VCGLRCDDDTIALFDRLAHIDELDPAAAAGAEVDNQYIEDHNNNHMETTQLSKATGTEEVCFSCRANEIWANCGAGWDEVPGFVPTNHELYALMKHWLTVGTSTVFDNDPDPSIRDEAFGRFLEIEGLLGEAVAERAADEAFDQYWQEAKSYFWRSFHSRDRH